MLRTHGAWIGVLAIAAGCSREAGPRSMAPAETDAMTRSPSGAPDASARPPIGTARMLADGTLELDLRATAGNTHGQARVVYPPTHVEYKRVLEHLGGMRPGEEKLVPPWPDPWDAAKVEAAAHAHAKAKGWQSTDYTLEITGTDAEGNAVVTLSHVDDRRARTPGGGKSVSVRIEPKGYKVIRELGFQ